MSSPLSLLIHGTFALLMGIVLGLFYFSCLWLTVQRLPRSHHPVLLMVGSGITRLAIALLGFYLIGGGDWPPLLIALLGFLLARTLLIARWRPQAAFGSWAGDD